jgi:hypothetical protein
MKPHRIQGDLIHGRFSMAALDASGTEPRWNLIIPAGKYHGPTLAPVGGSYEFTREMFAAMVENWKANGSFRIPVRWGHEHEQNEDPAKAKELDRKAGNIIDLRATDAGLEGLTAWNDAGHRDVTAGEFDGWSAEFSMRHLNRLTGEVGGPLLSGVALTNRPFFNLMPPVAAAAVIPTEPTPQHPENVMNEEQLKALRASLGLAADADVSTILAAARKPAVLPDAVITAAVKPVQEQVIALTAALEVEKTKGLERDVDAQILRAKAGDGKTGRAIPELIAATAKDIAKSKGLKASEDFLAALPLSVPVVAIGHDSKQEDGNVSATAAQKELDALVAEKIKGGLNFKDAHRAAGRERKDLADLAFAVSPTTAANAEN